LGVFSSSGDLTGICEIAGSVALASTPLRRLAGTLAPSLLDRAARKAAQRARHAARLSVEELHLLRKSLDKLCDDVKYLAGLFSRRAVKTYRDRCEDVQEILGLANDAVVTKQLALELVADDRSDLAKPAGASCPVE
jgi:CHAD domain-containing protein